MIEEFIKRRFSLDCHWLDGNCYWFASILVKRFPFLQLYYEPIEGHFYAGKGSNFYDWRGKIEPKYKPILFSEIRKNDNLFYKHIIRDCIK